MLAVVVIVNYWEMTVSFYGPDLQPFISKRWSYYYLWQDCRHKPAPFQERGDGWSPYVQSIYCRYQLLPSTSQLSWDELWLMSSINDICGGEVVRKCLWRGDNWEFPSRSTLNLYSSIGDLTPDSEVTQNSLSEINFSIYFLHKCLPFT